MARADLIWRDLAQDYEALPVDSRYGDIYADEDERLRPVFAWFHDRLNDLFTFLNVKAAQNGHYNANQSRELLALIDEMDSLFSALRNVGVEIILDTAYSATIFECRKFLQPTEGSTIPEEFGPAPVFRYDPIFTNIESSVAVKDRAHRSPLTMVGEGSYAMVHKFYEPSYDLVFARKKARKDVGPKDLQRFREEFKMLKSLSFPYILQVHLYNDVDDSYIMEYCDYTLQDFVDKRPAMSRDVRKRIALQFLYGVNYLHSKEVLHRDLSRRNVLVKAYDSPAVVVKLSDFGLFKGSTTELTSAQSSMKGTLRDPTLTSFKDFDVLAEVYAVGHLLSFIFSGRTNIGGCARDVQAIVNRCTENNRENRYMSVYLIIRDVEQLGLEGSTATA